MILASPSSAYLSCREHKGVFVTPAKAGVQSNFLDTGFHRYDD